MRVLWLTGQIMCKGKRVQCHHCFRFVIESWLGSLLARWRKATAFLQAPSIPVLQVRDCLLRHACIDPNKTVFWAGSTDAMLSSCVRFLLSTAFISPVSRTRAAAFPPAPPAFITFLKQERHAEGLWCPETILHFSALPEDLTFPPCLIFKMIVFKKSFSFPTCQSGSFLGYN